MDDKLDPRPPTPDHVIFADTVIASIEETNAMGWRLRESHGEGTLAYADFILTLPLDHEHFEGHPDRRQALIYLAARLRQHWGGWIDEEAYAKLYDDRVRHWRREGRIP